MDTTIRTFKVIDGPSVSWKAKINVITSPHIFGSGISHEIHLRIMPAFGASNWKNFFDRRLPAFELDLKNGVVRTANTTYMIFYDVASFLSHGEVVDRFTDAASELIRDLWSIDNEGEDFVS